MNKRRQLKEALLARLADKVTGHSFRKGSGQRFEKHISGGKLSLHLTFHPALDGLDVTADVAIRFDEVENHKNFAYNALPEGMRMSPSLQKKTYTMGCDLGRLSAEGFVFWKLKSENDVEDVSDGILERFRTVGLPYLEKYSRMELALEALVDERTILFQPTKDRRLMAALALARILERKDYYPKVLKSFNKIAEDSPDCWKTVYREFLSSLDSRMAAVHQPATRCRGLGGNSASKPIGRNDS